MHTKRYLKNRKIVTDHMTTWIQPMSVEDIFFQLIEKNIKLSLSTVYKHVQELQLEGYLTYVMPHRTKLYYPSVQVGGAVAA